MQKIYIEGSESVSKNKAYNLTICNLILTVLIGLALIWCIISFTQSKTEKTVRQNIQNEVTIYNAIGTEGNYGAISDALYKGVPIRINNVKT